MGRSRISTYALLAVLALMLGLVSACGSRDDPYPQCYDICDKHARCHPSVSDSDYDACVQTCRAEGYTVHFAECVLALGCENSFEQMLNACYVDPMKGLN